METNNGGKNTKRGVNISIPPESVGLSWSYPIVWLWASGGFHHPPPKLLISPRRLRPGQARLPQAEGARCRSTLGGRREQEFGFKSWKPAAGSSSSYIRVTSQSNLERPWQCYTGYTGHTKSLDCSGSS